MRHQAGIVLPGYNPLKVANAPTIGTATAGDTQVSVAFTAPACVGGGAISSYTVFANCGVKTTSGASSPLVVTGLTNGTAYTFKAIATNAFGPSYPSAASNSTTPTIPTGQQAYTSVGTFSWVAPAGVTSVAAVAVGGGGYLSGPGKAGGGGGGLAYRNSVSVTPGSSYNVVVGGAQSDSSVFSMTAGGGKTYAYACCLGRQGTGGAPSGTYTAGYSGGTGGANNQSGGGGGAAGYAGNGGNGGTSGPPNGGSCATRPGAAGSGGGGGGGAGPYCGNSGGGGGGGVGILGQGSSGSGGSISGNNGTGGGGGSGGATGATGATPGGAGGLYGGGGGSNYNGGLGAAGTGAIRIIWPGTTRSFPSTCTGNL